MKRRVLLIGTGIILISVFVSAITSYLVIRNQINTRFVSAPREDNPDYGYLEVNGQRYYQIYTTTQVNIGNGLHYHKIDLRGSTSVEPNEEDLQNQKEIQVPIPKGL